MNNGRILQQGVVDFVKCQNTERDFAFFENVKPMLEGAKMFKFNEDKKQWEHKQFFLDFSLMRIHIDSNNEKEIIMVDRIVKPEMPPATLEQIRL